LPERPAAATVPAIASRQEYVYAEVSTTAKPTAEPAHRVLAAIGQARG